MQQSIFETYESEVRSYCRKFPVVFAKAKGSFLYDEDGSAYIDFFCGAGSVNYGHNNDFIKDRVVEYLQNDGVVHSLDMYAQAKGSFIEYFVENILKPRGLDYKLMFPGPTGTNGIEAALKLARKVKKRQNIFALMGCFHGMTLGALALTTDEAARAGAGVPLSNVTHIPAPYMFPELDTIRYMETILEDDHSGIDKPAALIFETLQAEGGIYTLPDEWIRRARELCDRHDMLLIIDEIQVGCARTGPYFAFERAGIQPDIFVMAKSIGGMGMPFALTLFKPELDVFAPGEHNGTFRGFQPAMVAAKAGLEYMLANRIEEETRRKGKLVEEYLEANLKKINPSLSYRGLGLIWGIDFAAFPEGTAKRASRACFERGLVIELAGRGDSVLKLMPALTIDDATLLRGLDIIMDAIASLRL
jgi:diaminobutyrate-2-oxoglutarate transaminase